MDATTNIKLCNGHSRTHIRYGMEGDHITHTIIQMEWSRITYHLPSVNSDLRHTWNSLTILNHTMDAHALTFAMEWRGEIIIRTETQLYLLT